MMMNDKLSLEGGSYRDIAGQVYSYLEDNFVYRTITQYGYEDYKAVRQTNFIKQLITQNKLIDEQEISPEQLGFTDSDIKLCLAHPKLNFISYPYEWTFGALKKAALFHLDLQLSALEYDISLVDASAYNIQFIGSEPIFIDSLSFRPYKEGEYWIAHRQFCEEFLYPLLLTAKTGVPFQDFLRASPDGIKATTLSQLLSWQQKCSLNMLTNLVFPAKYDTKTIKTSTTKKPMPKMGLIYLLKSLKKWITKLNYQPKNTTWQDYETTTSYSHTEKAAKEKFLQEFIIRSKIKTIWDLGCNRGDYSEFLLSSGAQSVTGFEFDQGALTLAWQKAEKLDKRFLPLYMDLCNPSPAQGWHHRCFKSLSQRYHADGIVALALIHHFAIGHNLPLDYICNTLCEMAPCGVIEFVPKTDPMVQILLSQREDIFYHYSLNNFLSSLTQYAKIISQQQITDSGRVLVYYEK